MKKSTTEDRQRWPREEFPHWNRFMDWCDKEIDNGLLDIKTHSITKPGSLEIAAKEFMNLIEVSEVADHDIL